MSLFPEIDKEKTKTKVKRLLSNYLSMIRIAGEDYQPKITATYSFELKSYTGVVSNQIEAAITRKVTAEQEIIKISKAMNSLNAYDRQLIYDKYMDNRELTNTAIYLNHNMSESTFYRELDAALLKFAESYDCGRLLTEK